MTKQTKAQIDRVFADHWRTLIGFATSDHCNVDTISIVHHGQRRRLRMSKDSNGNTTLDFLEA